VSPSFMIFNSPGERAAVFCAVVAWYADTSYAYNRRPFQCAAIYGWKH
jgi:hypothetical protein